MDKELSMKTQIAEAFKSLCIQQSPDSIKIKDIIQACNINRSTFYYYFPDKEGLFEWIYHNDLARYYIKAREKVWIHNYIRFLTVVHEEISFYSQVLKSSLRAKFEEMLFQDCYAKDYELFAPTAEKESIDQEQLIFNVRYHAHASTAMLLEYIEAGAKTDPSKEVTKYSLLPVTTAMLIDRI